MTFILCLILGICLARVQYLAAKFNMKARWNGYGAIESVQNKTADAPMAYRVLVPWLIGKPSLVKYEALQTILMVAALYSVSLAWGVPVMLMTGLLLTATFFYDYWDWTAEMIGFSLALVSFPLALVGVVVHSLSRETAPLIGAFYALRTNDLVGGMALTSFAFVLLYLVRRVQGEHPLYCERFMIARNWRELKSKPAAWISFGVSILILAGAFGTREMILVLALVGAGWTMAVAAETRVFSAVLPYAAAFLVGVL